LRAANSELGERIEALRRLDSEGGELMNVDADDAPVAVPGRLNLVVDPLTPGGVCSNEDDVAGLAEKLIIDPCLDRLGAPPVIFSQS
jgi:hypothetical protein